MCAEKIKNIAEKQNNCRQKRKIKTLLLLIVVLYSFFFGIPKRNARGLFRANAVARFWYRVVCPLMIRDAFAIFSSCFFFSIFCFVWFFSFCLPAEKNQRTIVCYALQAIMTKEPESRMCARLCALALWMPGEIWKLQTRSTINFSVKMRPFSPADRC